MTSIFVELVEDNEGRTAENSADFATLYSNSGDTNLGTDAPSDRYVATSLGQESVVTGSDQQSQITIDPS